MFRFESPDSIPFYIEMYRREKNGIQYIGNVFLKYFTITFREDVKKKGLVSLEAANRDDISMQFASRDFRQKNMKKNGKNRNWKTKKI